MLKRFIRRFRQLQETEASDPIDVLTGRPLLFDDLWYRQNNSEVSPGRQAAAEHYHRTGWREGRDPSPHFDGEFYLRTYADIRAAGGDPLIHYITFGSREGRSPNPDFDGKAYLEKHDLLESADWTALEHCLDNYRSARWPLTSKDDEGRTGDGELVGEEALRESGLFDAAWYRTRNVDIVQAGLDPLQHYLDAGSAENRWPNPYFDPVYYAAQVPGLRDAPLFDYLQSGWKNGRSPSTRFDLSRYAALTGWSPESGEEPLGRFLRKGLPGIDVPPVDVERPDNFIHLGRRGAFSIREDSLARYPVRYEPASETVSLGSFVPNALRLHWIVPDFDTVGGGGMTIFRMVRALSLRGHRQTIWTHGSGPHETGAAAFDDIVRHYQTLDAEVRTLDEADFRNAEGDAVIATDWPSVWPAKAMRKVKRRFYFVQDYEPAFHPRGTMSILAEATYGDDIDCICASPWLARLMSERYGRWSRSFHLAADTEIYKPKASPKRRPDLQHDKPQRLRIAFYARHHTARRAVDLGLLALEILAERGHDFVVDLFGERDGLQDAPFAFVQHGVKRPEALAKLYREATIGMVFSATNYSLIPQEMMACGLPVLELDVESTREVYPDGVVTRAEPDSHAIADQMEKLLLDPDRRASQSAAALNWVSGFSWEGAADIVETSIRDRLEELGHEPAGPVPARTTPKISVVIPTLNGGDRLLEVLERVKSQRLKDPFEILVIDSGSTDGTLKRMAADPDITLHEIEPVEFGHGRTRNLGVEMTTGEYVAFLTQDALPVGDAWLADYVLMLDHFPEAGGAFGRHIAEEDASPFVKRDINAHFQRFFDHPLAVSRDLDPKRYEDKDEVWRQMLHYYSDNNSCLRRSVWEEIPYRDVDFGEDQLFAEDIVEAGYQKVYVPSATVYHSHDFDAEETHERAEIEARFFKTYFGYDLVEDEAMLRRRLKEMNEADSAWAKMHRIEEDEIEFRYELNAARFKGYLAAQEENDGRKSKTGRKKDVKSGRTQ